MIGDTTNSKNSLVKIFLIFIILEIAILIVSGLLKYYVVLSIGGSILSGTIVGLFVTFSQAKISASIYEESRVRNRHLDDIKQFLKDKDAVDLAGIMIHSDQHKKELFDLEDIDIHWPEFSKKMRELSEIELKLQKNKQGIEENNHYVKNHTQEIIERVNLEIEKRNQKLDFLPEFFNPGQDLSYIDLSGKSRDIKVSDELVGSFSGFINNLINTVHNELSRGEKAHVIFQQTLSNSLSEDGEEFQRCIDTGANGCISIISLFWRVWSDHIGSLANIPLHSAAYRARLTQISNLKSLPDKFTSAVNKAIQSTLTMEEKIIDIMKLMEQEKEFKSKEIGLKSEAEKIKITIENSYFLKGDCSRTKE